jgi:hypothetical protein
MHGRRVNSRRPAAAEGSGAVGLRADNDDDLWGILEDAFSCALLLDQWVRLDDHVDGHGLVARVRTAQP